MLAKNSTNQPCVVSQTKSRIFLPNLRFERWIKRSFFRDTTTFISTLFHSQFLLSYFIRRTTFQNPSTPNTYVMRMHAKETNCQLSGIRLHTLSYLLLTLLRFDILSPHCMFNQSVWLIDKSQLGTHFYSNHRMIHTSRYILWTSIFLKKSVDSFQN